MVADDGREKSEFVRAAVERYEEPLVRYTHRLTGDLELARDVVQEAFLRLCREPSAKVADHLAPWLYTVCRRRALDVLKKESRMHASTNGLAHAQAAPAATETPLEREETANQLAQLLDRLPANQQEVVRLKFQAGLSYREIAQVTDLSVSNVGYLIHTALETLRRQMVGAAGS